MTLVDFLPTFETMISTDSNAAERVRFNHIVDDDRYQWEKPYVLAQMPNLPDGEETNVEVEQGTHLVKDIRGSEDRLSLDEDLFAYIQHESKTLDFWSSSSIEPYVEEMCQVVKKYTGTKKAICYDFRESSVWSFGYCPWLIFMQVRDNKSMSADEMNSMGRNIPAPPIETVHIGLSHRSMPEYSQLTVSEDHTPAGGHGRLLSVLTPNEQKQILSGALRARIIKLGSRSRPPSKVLTFDGKCVAPNHFTDTGLTFGYLRSSQSQPE